VFFIIDSVQKKEAAKIHETFFKQIRKITKLIN
jgi:hypothetical protein